MFYIVEDIDIASYGDDSTLCVSATFLNKVVLSLEKATDTLLKWFNNNLIKSNADKCHLRVNTNNSVNFKIGKINI